MGIAREGDIAIRATNSLRIADLDGMLLVSVKCNRFYAPMMERRV
jgi:hypothetical protein